MTDTLLAEFPPVSTAQWEEAIRKDLQGAGYDEKLLWQTDEGITIKPYYRSEDVSTLPHLDASPGEAPYVRGARATNDWKIIEDPAAFEGAFSIRGDVWREQGATAVQELAFSLAAAAEYLAENSDNASKIAFHTGIGSSFFFEIAKLRALRLLWSRVVESFGRPAAPALIHTRTLAYNNTIYDPYINMLRATTEAMAAIIGGADSLYILPFDASYKTPDEFSRRLARNTQIILKAEAYFDRVADPAGGSYYVEVLTDSIAQAAWKLFQEIEGAGGFAQASTFIEEQIAESHQAKQAAVAAAKYLPAWQSRLGIAE